MYYLYFSTLYISIIYNLKDKDIIHYCHRDYKNIMR